MTLPSRLIWKLHYLLILPLILRIFYSVRFSRKVFKILIAGEGVAVVLERFLSNFDMSFSVPIQRLRVLRHHRKSL